MYARFNVMSSNLNWKFEFFPKALPCYLPIALTAAADFGNMIQSKFCNISRCSMLGPQYITRKLLAYGCFPCHCHLIYVYIGVSVQSHSHMAASWAATRWQETQVHRTVITLEFHSAPSHGRRHKYIDLWEHLSSTTKFECALMLLDLSMESSVNEDNTTTQHRNVFHCENTVCCQALQQQL
jgi:hypothetical protein